MSPIASTSVELEVYATRVDVDCMVRMRWTQNMARAVRIRLDIDIDPESCKQANITTPSLRDSHKPVSSVSDYIFSAMKGSEEHYH